MLRRLLTESDTIIPGEFMLNTQGGTPAPISARSDHRELMEKFRNAKQEVVGATCFQILFSSLPTRSTASKPTIPTI